MISLDKILAPERACQVSDAVTKKAILEQMAQISALADDELDSSDIFSALSARERLGSTGIGHGVAIPHARISHCKQIIGTLVRLQNPIDFDASDEKPVDLLFSLIVPEEATNEHLSVLARLAELFHDEGFCQKLRDTKNEKDLFNLMINQTL